MSERIVAIVQARMGSRRLPGKVLLPVLDEPILGHIIRRLQVVKRIDDIIVATSDRDLDNPIADFCAASSITCFRGSEEDVLDRFYRAAVQAAAQIVIRITGDCPLVDPILVHQLIEYFETEELDFCGIAAGAGVAREDFSGRYPDGLDAEIMKMSVLKLAWMEAEGPLYREHVTPFIWKHPERFKIGTLKSRDKDYSRLRWTVDNREDYKLVKWIYEELYPENPAFDMYAVLDLLKRYPEKVEDNQHFIGREDYEQFWQ